MKYQVIRIIEDENQGDIRLVYVRSEDGDDEILELRDAWLEKNDVSVGSFLITDEKGYLTKYDESTKHKLQLDEFRECVIKTFLGNYDEKIRLAKMLLDYDEYDNHDKASFKIIENLYNEIRIASENNIFKDDFCDIAIRYGDYYYEGIGVRKNKMNAYKYYLEALTVFKYRKSQGETDNYELERRIDSRIERYEAEKDSFEYNKIVTQSFVLNYPMFLYDIFRCGSEHYRIKGAFRKISEGEYYLNILRIGPSGAANPNLVPRFLIPIPEQELCIFSRSINIYLKGAIFGSEYVNEFIADSFNYNQEHEMLTFINSDKKVVIVRVPYLEIEEM